MASNDFFSLPSSCARLGSSHTLGSSNSPLTCSSFSDLISKSKIPPKFGFPTSEVGQQVGNTIEAFGFHLGFFW